MLIKSWRGIAALALATAIMAGAMPAYADGITSEQAQQILATDLPVAPLYFRGRMVLVKPWVQNLVITAKDDYPGLSFLHFRV